MDRRTFLSALVAAPCVSFAGRLSFCQDADKAPAWFRDALKKMKETGTPGLVLIASDRADESALLGGALWDMIDGQNADAHELLLTSAFICLTPGLAVRLGVRKADEPVNQVLLDPDGKRVAAAHVAYSEFAKPETFAATFAPLLYGKDLERLKERAATARKMLEEEIRQAIELLDSDQVEARDRAATSLTKVTPLHYPFLALEHRTTASVEVRARLKSILEAIYQRQDPRRLPYGTRKPEFKEHGCGGWYEVPENAKDDVGSMVECGMGRVSDRKVRILLRFLAK